jgi:hypothetical protein
MTRPSWCSGRWLWTDCGSTRYRLSRKNTSRKAAVTSPASWMPVRTCSGQMHGIFNTGGRRTIRLVMVVLATSPQARALDPRGAVTMLWSSPNCAGPCPCFSDPSAYNRVVCVRSASVVEVAVAVAGIDASLASPSLGSHDRHARSQQCRDLAASDMTTQTAIVHMHCEISLFEPR